MKIKKPMVSHQFGGFKVDLYFNEKKPKGCYFVVNTESGIWHMKGTLAHGGYGYLLKCAEVEDWPSVEAWVYSNYAVSTFIGSEEEFSNDVISSISRYSERLSKKAEEDAANVTEQDEALADSEMRDAISYANMDKKERTARKEMMRSEIRDMIKDLEGEQESKDSEQESAEGEHGSKEGEHGSKEGEQDG